jgi:hypothetical protein
VAMWEDGIFIKSYVMMVTDIFDFDSICPYPEILIALKFSKVVSQSSDILWM